MASYYNLIASLPDLRAEGDLPITYEGFLKYCETNVSDEVYEMLEKLSLSSTEGPLVEEWSRVYGMIQKEMNYQRSMNLGKSYPSVYEKDSGVSQVVAAALSAKNPLEAERLLLDYEFDNLDLLVGHHVFDDHVLFGYAIKLKLLERLKSFEQEKGKAEFDALFEGIKERVYSL